MTDIVDWLSATQRRVHRTDHDRTLTLRRTYDATSDEVWSAWTDPDRLRRWFASVRGDLAVGGTVVLDMGDDPDVTCRIIGCEPPRRLAVTWSHPGQPDTVVELGLSDEPGGTAVELTHTRVPDALVPGYGPGWDDFLDRLAAVLENRDPATVSWEANHPHLKRIWTTHRDVPGDGWPGVEVEGDTATLTASRHYPAEPAEVWSALTDPERLARWFGTTTLDDKHWTIAFDNGKAFGAIRECVPNERLVVSWRWDHEDSESTVTAQLEASHDGTLLRLRQTNVTARSAIGYGAGWHAHLAGLAAHIDDSDPESDWYAEFSLARLMLQRR